MDTDLAQRVVLAHLLEAHPAMLAMDDLQQQVGTPGVDEAVAHLGSAGLANRLGEMVGASHAAVRARALLAAP